MQIQKLLVTMDPPQFAVYVPGEPETLRSPVRMNRHHNRNAEVTA